MRFETLLAFAAVLAGCAVRPDGATVSPAGPRRCLSASAVSGRYVAAPDSIMFEVGGKLRYRNVLARPCPGLARLGGSAGILFESSTGGEICSGDPVRFFDSRDTGPNRLLGPVCRLGAFVPSPRR